MVLIQSQRLQLRALHPVLDAAPMLALLNDPGFVRFIGERGVRSQAQAQDYITQRILPAYALHGHGMYAVERRSDGAWLGTAGLVVRDGLPAPDIGYALLQEFAGHGYGREAAQAVFDHARTQLQLPHLFGITQPDNGASVAILRGLGMQARGLMQLPGSEAWVSLFATAGAPPV